MTVQMIADVVVLATGMAREQVERMTFDEAFAMYQATEQPINRKDRP